MSKARERIMEERYRVHHAAKPRRIIVLWRGKVVRGTADQSRLRAGCLFRQRLRLLRRFDLQGFRE